MEKKWNWTNALVSLAIAIVAGLVGKYVDVVTIPRMVFEIVLVSILGGTGVYFVWKTGQEMWECWQQSTREQEEARQRKENELRERLDVVLMEMEAPLARERGLWQSSEAMRLLLYTMHEHGIPFPSARSSYDTWLECLQHLRVVIKLGRLEEAKQQTAAKQQTDGA